MVIIINRCFSFFLQTLKQPYSSDEVQMKVEAEGQTEVEAEGQTEVEVEAEGQMEVEAEGQTEVEAEGRSTGDALLGGQLDAATSVLHRDEVLMRLLKDLLRISKRSSSRYKKGGLRSCFGVRLARIGSFSGLGC